MSDDLYRAIAGGDVRAYYGLVREQAGKVVHARGAHPEGLAWDEEDETEVVQEFWASGKHEALILRATDDDSLRALVYTALHNRVLDELRKTELGRLGRRVSEILHEGPFVEAPKGFWRKDGCPPGAFAGRESDLLGAIGPVRVSVVRWNSTKRASPHTDRDSFLRLFDALFAEANGAVEFGVLLRVLGRRLGVGPAPRLEELDAPDARLEMADPLPGPERAVMAVEDEAETGSAALEIWGQLSVDERRMLPHQHKTVRQSAEAIGWGKTKATRVRTRLNDKLEVLVGATSEMGKTDLVGELLQLADIL